MLLQYSRRLYSKNALFRACYKFTDDAYIHLDADRDNYMVTIIPKSDYDKTNYALELANQMIEETNREIVIEQTKNIRQILFARSMASTVVYDDDLPETDADVSDKSAMKDWFSNE